MLALLREGLSNEEVAERLGISLAGAKYHVSEILSKLGVASREEAARWSPQLRPWWATALAPLGALWRRGSSSALAASVGVGLAVAVAVGLGLLVWGLVRTSGGGDDITSALSGAIVLGEGNYGGADWSPDGRSIAFGIDGLLYRADGPDFERYGQGPLVLDPPQDGGAGSSPRWSPDGSRIALLGSHPGRGGLAEDRSFTIFVVNADGSGLRDLLPGTAAELSPSTAKVVQGWLDDNTIAFDEHCGTACQQPYLLHVDTGEVEPVVGTADATPSGILGTVYHYAPDKRWIAVENMGRYSSLVLYDRERHELLNLAAPTPNAPDTGGLIGPWQVFDSWAADSSAFLYDESQVGADGSPAPPYSLHRYDIGTGEDRVLAPSGRGAALSADGSRVAYVTEATAERACGGDARVACIAVMDVSSGEELYRFAGPIADVLTGQTAGVAGPAFLPDGRLLYVTAAGDFAIADGDETGLLLDGTRQPGDDTRPFGFIEVRLSPDGSKAVVAEPGRVTLVPIPPRASQPRLPEPAPLSPPDVADTIHAPPFLIAGPLDPLRAITEEADTSGFVLDLRIGQVYAIIRDGSNFQEGDSFVPVGWVDDETLLIYAMRGGENRPFRASLDGLIELADDAAVATASSPQRTGSANGEWLADTSGGSPDLLVRRIAPTPQFRLTHAAYPLWSPEGSRLAFIGNVCAGFDAFIFDPNTQELRNLTAGLDSAVLVLSWRPDGAALAADVLPFDGDHRILGLIDATTGDMEPLIDVPITGELSPGQWSPDGNRLLFSYIGGRGFCDTQPGTPTGGTELEVIGG